MTNFQPFKDKIWEAVKADNRTAFDEACEKLMEKGVEELWRMGWQIRPKDIREVYELLDNLTKWSHECWLKAMECGDAPPEDVSPGECWTWIKHLIKDAIENPPCKKANKKKKK